jgi:hypothetical protein
MKMSIDDATPEEWNKVNRKKDCEWMDEVVVNDHPFFGDKPDNKPDMVNRPTHYNNGKMECIDAIHGMLTHDEYIGYLRGNALKYNWRCRYKGQPIEDLRKARWYEERLIAYMLEHPSDK